MAEAQNPNSNMTDDILLFNILPRLPAKSVRRFMCVSRQWHSFLTTPVFAKMQLIHHVSDDYDQHHHKLLLLSTTPPYKFSTISCETPKDGLTAIRSLPFEVGSHTHISIVSSLHGLVCVKRSRFINEVEYTDLVLWNPLTGDYKTLSKPSSHEDTYYISYIGKFGLYYTSSDGDYKLLCVTDHPNVYVYSLKSDSWRKVVSTKRTSKSIPYFLKPSILLNEKLYFLRQKRIYGQHPSYFITRFDTKTEKLKEIATPTFKESTDCMGFMVLRGSIHFSVAFGDSTDGYHKIELWRMNGDGFWTKMVTRSPIERLPWHEKLLHIMMNEDWLMYCDGHVYQRNMKKHTIDVMCGFKGMAEINQGWKYIETLLSPNSNHAKD